MASSFSDSLLSEVSDGEEADSCPSLYEAAESPDNDSTDVSASISPYLFITGVRVSSFNKVISLRVCSSARAIAEISTDVKIRFIFLVN
jgi:hypothetical protein